MMTDTTVTFRQLVLTDAPQFRALRLAALRDHPECFGAPHDEEEAQGVALFERRIAGFQDGDAAFGAFRGANMIGIAAMFRAASGTMRHRGTLWGVYVVPELRGTDAAERLIAAVIEHARKHVDVLTGLVTCGNDRARAFYARLGFDFSGIERKILKVDGRWHDQEILVLDLTDAA
ncbi:MAG TPA: GNAT family N-acetyltransferase [Candidatus Sulfotelmatobacter sp.]|jgi:ribosomal protein S18 acetylase RimI-like enzyme|nr:GNAT family N-acetyltransferase [Candidatus Sulfotelmatobacter sp.]